ncbi:MAG: SpoIIE family protein phosphatase [Candidatus Zixiibacteriota bacterium]|nr:MAG: SpoIIE family protein phosphatase [candidate division Zixibacteria bacterium]
MFRRPIKEINAEFIAEEKYLDSIQKTVRESCVAASMSRKDIASVLLAIEEGATNVIRHAYLYEKGIIRLRVVIYPKLVVFSLIDYGRSFQPEGSGTLDLERLVESGRKGGLGFYMIQKIMDSVEYISTAGFNELRMIKHISEPSPVGRTFLRRLFTLRVKFSIWTFFIMLIIIGVSIYYFDYRTSEQMYKHKHETVRALAETIADQAAGYFINRRSDVEFDELIVSYRRANPELQLVVLTDGDGIIRAHSDDILNIRKPYVAPDQVSDSIIGVPQTFRSEHRVWSYLVTPIMTGERLLGNVHVTYSTAGIYLQLTESRKKIFFLTVILVLFGILGIYLLSNYFVSPILNITRRVRRFTSGDLEAELPLTGAEEFFEISRAFNQMMTRLSQDRRNIVEREKMAKEIEVASQIQQTLLPRQLPSLPHLEIEAFYRAASMIGGDLYNVFRIGDHRYCLAVADVSGKGVPASMMMSILRTVIQIQASEQVSAKKVLSKVNDYLVDNMPRGMFITVFLVIYNARSHKINFVSAGHNPMLFFRADKQEIMKFNPKGMPLGIPSTNNVSFDDSLEEIALTLRQDDLFFLFTDGVTEARDRDNNQYGLDRLTNFLQNYLLEKSKVEVSELSKAIVSELDDFTGFLKTADDVTFILARCDLSEKQPSQEANTGVEVKHMQDEHPADSPDRT